MQNTYFPREDDDVDINDVLKDDEEMKEDVQRLQDRKRVEKELKGQVVPDGTEADDETDFDGDEEDEVEDVVSQDPEAKARLDELRVKGVVAVIDIVASIGAKFRKVPEDKVPEWKAAFHENVDGLSVLIAGDDLSSMFNKLATKGSPTTRMLVLAGFLILMMFITPVPESVHTNQGNTVQADSSINLNPKPSKFSVYGRR